MRRYLSSIKRYIWVLPLCMILASAFSYLLVKSQPPVYQASSTMIVVTNGPNNSFAPSISATDALNQAINYASEIQSGAQMQVVYASDPKIRRRGYTADDLLADITTSTSTTAATITITASTTTASDAVLLANDVALSFQNYIQKQLQSQLDAVRTNLNNQLAIDNKDKTYLEAQIEGIANPTDPRISVDQTNLQDTIHSIDSVEAQLLQLPLTVSSNVVVIQKAELSAVSVTEKSSQLVATAAGLGLLIGLLIVLLLVFIENRLRSEEQVKEKLGLAYIGGVSNDRGIPARPVQVGGTPAREFSNAVVNLRLTGILPQNWQAPRGVVLLVTSSQSAEGKTAITAALAATAARGGATVCVVDGNLRQPGTHLAFAMKPGGPGLSGLLNAADGGAVDSAVQRSPVPGIWLLPGGAPMEDASFLLEQKLPSILTHLRKRTDLIIIDGPPVLSGAEASIMASRSDGVALVIDFRHAKVPLLLRAKELLNSLTQTPVGVVMNRLPRRRRNDYFATAYSRPEGSEQWVPIQVRSGTDNGNGNGNGDKAGNGGLPQPIPATPGSTVAKVAPSPSAALDTLNQPGSFEVLAPPPLSPAATMGQQNPPPSPYPSPRRPGRTPPPPLQPGNR